MNARKLMELKERADRAYALLLSLSEDDTQSKLVRIIARDARNHVSSMVLDIRQSLERRVKK